MNVKTQKYRRSKKNHICDRLDFDRYFMFQSMFMETCQSIYNLKKKRFKKSNFFSLLVNRWSVTICSSVTKLSFFNHHDTLHQFLFVHPKQIVDNIAELINSCISCLCCSSSFDDSMIFICGLWFETNNISLNLKLEESSAVIHN